MRNISFLVTVVSGCGLFALAGCGTNAMPNSTGANNTAATRKDEPAKNVLKVGDASPDRAVKVSELVDGVAADKEAWKGKEVAVTGYVSATSGPYPKLLLTMTDDQTSTNKRNISCNSQGNSNDVFSKTISVKGKISSVSTDGDVKSVSLDPCELKK